MKNSPSRLSPSPKIIIKSSQQYVLQFSLEILYKVSMRKLSWLLTLMLAVSVINYPNPFNPQAGESTTFECTSDTTTEAFLYIYDMSARLMLRKAFNLQGGFINRSGWDGYSDYNELVGSGIYLYQILDKKNKRLGKGQIWVINQ